MERIIRLCRTVIQLQSIQRSNQLQNIRELLPYKRTAELTVQEDWTVSSPSPDPNILVNSDNVVIFQGILTHK